MEGRCIAWAASSAKWVRFSPVFPFFPLFGPHFSPVSWSDAAAKAKAAGAVQKPPSAHKGVTWDKYAGKWLARIGIGGGKKRTLGRFDDKELAAACYRRADAERELAARKAMVR